jgi:type IV secretion system protein VirD4
LDDIWGTSGGVYLGYGCTNLEGPPENMSRKPVQYVGDRHLITVGPSGVGKSRKALTPVLLSCPHWSMIVIDPSAELARATAAHRAKYGEVYFLNAYGVQGFQRGSHNPMLALNPESELFVDDAYGLSEAIITPNPQAREPHWPLSAQDLTTASTMYNRLKFGDIGSFNDVRKDLTKTAAAFRETIKHMREVAIAKDWEVLEHKANRFLDIKPDDKELHSILSTAQTETRWLDSPPIQRSLEKGFIDFASFKQSPKTVYIILPAKRIVTQAAWMKLVLTSALQELIGDERKPKVPVLVAMDEAFQINFPAPLPVLVRYAPLARKYGVKFWTFFQDIYQLEMCFGNPGWKSFVANTGVQQFFAPTDMDTAEFISRRAGTTAKAIPNSSYSADLSTGLRSGSADASFAWAEFPVFRPNDIINMDQTLVFCHKLKKTLIAFLPDPSEMKG